MRSALLLTTVVILPALAAQPDQRAGTFRTDATMVLVSVSVVDTHDRPAAGLEQQHFRVYQDGKEQTISWFAHEDAPVTVGLIFDASGSMDGKIGRAREVVARFCDNLNPEDDMFLVTVQKTARLAANSTRDCGAIQNALLATRPEGLTALLDAVPLAFQRFRKIQNRRKVILLVSDGGENASRVHPDEIRRVAVEAGVPVYVAALVPGPRDIGEAAAMDFIEGRQMLDGLVEHSGGRRWDIDVWQRPTEVARKIASEIHDQYLIGYHAPEAGRDGKYHRIAVKLAPERGMPRLSVFFRTGYFAPPE